MKASELSDLCAKGLKIYDVKKITEFICYKKEMKQLPGINKTEPSA